MIKKRYKSVFYWLSPEPYYLNLYARQVHVVRVVLAYLFGLILNLVFDIPHGSWMLISIIIVLGGIEYWGSVRAKAIQRISGSLLGAGAGLIAVLIYQYSSWLCYLWMLGIIGLSVWYTLGKGGYMALMVAITLALVVGLGNDLIDAALWRGFNVLSGSLIGILAAMLLWPTRAIDCWRFLLADNLREIAMLYSHIAQRTAVDKNMALVKFDQRLVRMRRLLPAIAQESDLSIEFFDLIQRRQRTLCSLLDRMSEVASTTQALDESASPRKSIVRALLHAAHAMKFNKPTLFGAPLVILDILSATKHPTHCYWLAAELNLVVAKLQDELNKLLNQMLETSTIERSLAHKLCVWIKGKPRI